MSRRNKPYDPAAATKVVLERQETEREKRRLIATGARVTTDKAGRVVSAWRSNVFNLLLERGTITRNQHDAAYRLSLDWAAWKGLDGSAEISPGRVDRASGPADPITDRMLSGGDRVARAQQDLAPMHRKILAAFMAATVEEDRPMQWRGIVQRETGVTTRDRQTELVVGALEALRHHYEAPRGQHRVAA